MAVAVKERKKFEVLLSPKSKEYGGGWNRDKLKVVSTKFGGSAIITRRSGVIEQIPIIAGETNVQLAGWLTNRKLRLTANVEYTQSTGMG